MSATRRRPALPRSASLRWVGGSFKKSGNTMLADQVLGLQATRGNHHVQRLLSRMHAVPDGGRAGRLAESGPVIRRMELEIGHATSEADPLPPQAAAHTHDRDALAVPAERVRQTDRRLKAERAPGQATTASPCIQRWKLEGPWNIGEPVHEELTARALRAAGMIGMKDKYTSRKAWEYVRGALWNDDPEGLLFDDKDWTKQWRPSTTKYSSGAKFVTKFKSGERAAEKGKKLGPAEVSLLKRSHFGDLQFLHGMAVEGEKAATTRANMLRWAEFTYKVGTGEIGGNTLLAQVPVAGIPELFPVLRKGTTVEMLFCIRGNLRRLADVKKRAIGSLLHMVQDTFAASHTEREYEKIQWRGKGGVAKEEGKVGKIKGFLSYTGQEKKKHAAKDVPSGYAKKEWEARAASAEDACRRILVLAGVNVQWETEPKWEIMDILGLATTPKPAGPGKEFK